MYESFQEIGTRAIPYVVNIKNGVDINENYNRLLKEFEPIINSLVKNIRHTQYIDIEDLKQEAAVTLWECCEKYDLHRGTSFYSYFYGCAFNSVTEYVYKYQTPIVCNKHEKERTKPLREFANQYYETHTSYPTIDDYIEAGFSKKLAERFYRYVLNANGTDFDLNEIDKIGDGCGSSIEEDYEKTEKDGELHRAISSLDDKYRKTIEMSFFEGLTNDDIASRLGRTKKTIIRYKKKALELLKDYMSDYE